MLAQETLYHQLIGAWELVSYHAHLPNDPSNRVYPLGPNARGTIMYTADGQMSAQLLRPGQPAFKQGDGISSGTASEWAEVGRNFVAYSGRFWLDEAGGSRGEPLLLHEMSVSNLPKLIGQVQRRTVNVECGQDGVRYLNLGVERMLVDGEVRVVRAKWRRMNNNGGVRPPPKL